MQRRRCPKPGYTLKALLLPIARSIQTEAPWTDQRRQPRLLRFDPERLTSAELQDLKERVMEAIQRRRLHS